MDDHLNTLAVDPGVRHSAFALYRGRRLIRAALVYGHPSATGPTAWATMAENFAEALRGVRFDRAVIERPEQYETSHARRADVSDLSATTGALTVPLYIHCGDVTAALPKEWKGSIPKDAHHLRIIGSTGIARLTGKAPRAITRGRLTDAELDAIEIPKRRSHAHNVFDAIGIGLWYLDR